MRSDEIIRDDFPTARKGWDKDAVLRHLAEVADSFAEVEGELVERSSQPAAAQRVSQAAGEQIGKVIAAGEELAAEIERTAREEAEGIRAAAQAEAKRITQESNDDAAEQLRQHQEEGRGIVSAARDEARARLKGAQQTIDDAAAEAERIRGSMDILGERLAADLAEQSKVRVEDGPSVVDQIEQTPEVEIDDPAGEDLGGADLATDDLVEPPKADESDASDEPEAAVPVAESVANGKTLTNEDLEGARLVAMNLALEGADADAIRAELIADYGQIEGVDALVADILARSGR